MKRTLRCRVGSDSKSPRFKPKVIVSWKGRLRVVCEPGSRRYSVMHAPTGLSLHHWLQGMPLAHARRALALAAPLCDWAWTDPDFVTSMPWEKKGSLWEAFEVIAEMAEP